MSMLKTGRPTREAKAIAAVTSVTETIRMSVNLPKGLHKKLKQKALDDETTITEIVLQLLEKHVSR